MKKLLLALLVLCGLSPIFAQRTITGIITDDLGEPLIGANILAKGTSTGTVSEVDGSYSLTLPEGTTVLLFSYTGFADEEIEIGVSNVINVLMAPDAAMLDEIVIQGYSQISERRRVASISQVNSEKLENIPFTDVNQLIQGNAAGVFATSNSGQPGAQQQVRIRGTGSISGGRNPLYVLDGIIIEQGNFAQEDGADNQVDILSQINPNDIESVTVLKDASATALYGSRGSNGVILINTKKGKVGKTKITAKAQYGITEENSGNFQLMNAQQWLDYERRILELNGTPAADIDATRPQSALDNTNDWVDAAFRQGSTYNLELQASGGNEKTRFFASGGYFNQEGTLIESGFERASLRSNIDHFASEKLTLGVNFNASYSQNQNAVNGNRFQSPLLSAFINRPTQGAINPETGELYTGLESDWAPINNDNFLYSQPLNYVNINTYRLLTKVSMDYNILDNLKFTQTGNIDMSYLDEVDYDDATTNDGENNGGSLDNSFRTFRTLTTQSLLKWYPKLGGDHGFDVLGGFEFQRTRQTGFRAFGKGFASGKLQTLNSASEANGVPGGSNTNYSFVSLLGQANYNFKEKYLLTASLRRDASSRFSAENRWATFWSVGGSWTLSEEDFMSGSNLFDNLRLRASYGTSGNATFIDNSNFPSAELYAFDVAYQAVPGSRPSQIGNDDLTWEKSNNFNIGLDFALLDNKIGGSVEWYNRISTDLLLQVPVSSTSGFTQANQNIGELQNTGVEVNLNFRPFDSPTGFNWNIDLNVAFNENEITKLPDGEDILNGSQIWSEGQPVRAFFMREWAGVNPDDGSPLWLTEEGATTSNYNAANRRIIGNAAPDWVGGLTSNMSYKGISLTAFLYTAQGHEIYNSSRRFIESDGQRFGWNHIVEAADHWMQPGDNATRPLPRAGGNQASNNRSTRFLEDASFIRLRNVSLGYRLPNTLMQKMKMQSVFFYVQGQNLWTQTDYSGFDPEADEDGVEFFRYPVGRIFTFGLDVTF